LIPWVKLGVIASALWIVAILVLNTLVHRGTDLRPLPNIPGNDVRTTPRRIRLVDTRLMIASGVIDVVMWLDSRSR
jgi:hypothetical protein